MGFRRLAAWMVVVSSVSVLAACGGSGSSDGGSAQVRLVNASSAYSGLDLTVGDSKLATGVAYGKASDYASATAGSSITATVQSAGTSLTSLAPTLTKGNHYSVITYGWSGSMRSMILQEEETAPDTNYSKLLVLNLAGDAGNLDVYLTQNIDNLSSTTPNVSALGGGSSSGYLTMNSGTYRVRITGTGKAGADLRLDIPSITLDSKQVSTLVITPTEGGVLVNSVRLIQQGTLSVAGTNNARARVVAALDGAKVSATLGTTTLMPELTAPKIGDYQLMNAGSPSLLVNVNGVALPVTTPALTAGKDYTFLVWGPVNNPQIAPLEDDNRLPTVSGTAKVRLINGLSSGGGLTMTLDYGAVVSNVLPGTASAPVSINASATGATSLLSVDSTPAYDASVSVVANGIYNVYIMGTPGNAVRVLRKDR